MSYINTLPDAPLEPPEAPEPRCPVCGEVCDEVYFTCSNEIVGCDVCLRKRAAWDFPECYDND